MKIYMFLSKRNVKYTSYQIDLFSREFGVCDFYVLKKDVADRN